MNMNSIRCRSERREEKATLHRWREKRKRSPVVGGPSRPAAAARGVRAGRLMRGGKKKGRPPSSRIVFPWSGGKKKRKKKD